MDLHVFIDSDHAGEKWTRKSTTRFLIYVIMSLIDWYFKKQSTIETSVFGTEFDTMKARVKILHAIRYRTRMMGVPISWLKHIYEDNISVIHNPFETRPNT